MLVNTVNWFLKCSQNTHTSRLILLHKYKNTQLGSELLIYGFMTSNCLRCNQLINHTSIKLIISISNSSIMISFLLPHRDVDDDEEEEGEGRHPASHNHRNRRQQRLIHVLWRNTVTLVSMHTHTQLPLDRMTGRNRAADVKETWRWERRSTFLHCCSTLAHLNDDRCVCPAGGQFSPLKLLV